MIRMGSTLLTHIIVITTLITVGVISQVVINQLKELPETQQTKIFSYNAGVKNVK